MGILNTSAKTITMPSDVETRLDRVAPLCRCCGYTILGGINSDKQIQPTTMDVARDLINKNFITKDVDRTKRIFEYSIRELLDIRNCYGDPLSDAEVQKFIGRIL